jgi:hypothetical protein
MSRRRLNRLRQARRAVGTLLGTAPQLRRLENDLDAIRAQVGGIEARTVSQLAPDRIRDSEFKVFSQFGEDGIIQFLVSRVPIERDVFVEFGVEDYRESNTRFLLVHDNWRGLIMDAGSSHQEFLASSGLLWRHHVDAVSAFIDRENINDLIVGAGIEGDIGLLSIDIDGNDYWVLDAIEAVSPRIVVIEYNSHFGREAAVTIPYDRGFVRSEAHWSNLYWGASLAAMRDLADRKGYGLVGGNQAGNNAFFVRRDVIGDLREVDVSDAYAPSRFRESLSRDGTLSYVSDYADRLALIADLSVYDVEEKRTLTIRERFGGGLTGVQPPHTTDSAG